MTRPDAFASAEYLLTAVSCEPAWFGVWDRKPDSYNRSFDGTVIPGGWINHHYIQLAYRELCLVFIASSLGS